jgi:DNA polymerase-3 subunit alpha
MNWDELKGIALAELEARDLSEEYCRRFKQEIKEIEKQGTNTYWVDNYVDEKRWDHNKNGLVFPWLLGMTLVDPVVSGIEHNWEYQKDFPDIDLDFVPDARQTIKEYATGKYINVCSVGNWVTYKPKSALQDVTRALGGDFREVIAFSKQLPDEFDDLSLADHDKFLEQEGNSDPKVRQEAHREVARYKPFYDFREKNSEIVDIAFRLVGKIRAQSTHAGGLIIADRPIDRIVPLSRIKDKLGGYNWTSQWSEGGAKLQMSKFGLIKYDILGLKTMQYIWQAGEFIKKSHGITIDWRDPDPMSDPPLAGRMTHPDGREEIIFLNDSLALKMCNELRTESVFQVETPIQKGIISDGKVKSFNDLVVYNALGRPGPIDMIPEYIWSVCF